MTLDVRRWDLTPEILSVGEILFDQFPDYRRVGGAPFNFSYHLKNLGFPVRFISRVGSDPDGRELIKVITDAGFGGNDIQIDKKHSTGKVVVKLDGQGVPDFEILPGAAYDYLEMNERLLSLLAEPLQVIYFGTLIQRTGPGRDFVEEVLSFKGPETAALCDINLRKGCYDSEVVARSVTAADILKLNEKELEEVRQILAPGTSHEDFPAHLMEEHGLEMLSVTCGGDGSELYVGGKKYSIGPAVSGETADTVGAGDAYTAILSIGYINKWEPDDILIAASRFAAGVCGLRGALPENRKFYEQYNEFSRGSESE